MRQHFVLELGIGHFKAHVIKYMVDKFFFFFL